MIKFTGSAGVQWSGPIKPEVQWGHIDGPLLHCSDATLHWLTLWERLLLKLRLTTVEKIDQRVTDSGGGA